MWVRRPSSIWAALDVPAAVRIVLYSAINASKLCSGWNTGVYAFDIGRDPELFKTQRQRNALFPAEFRGGFDLVAPVGGRVPRLAPGLPDHIASAKPQIAQRRLVKTGKLAALTRQGAPAQQPGQDASAADSRGAGKGNVTSHDDILHIL
ncbi:hypothetical protein C357_14556 [Citreicella sp. 357]|nr:hypothetical protein C357_14556 [Citreicella sp. 357]